MGQLEIRRQYRRLSSLRYMARVFIRLFTIVLAARLAAGKAGSSPP
jgi:hypothetical protein